MSRDSRRKPRSPKSPHLLRQFDIEVYVSRVLSDLKVDLGTYHKPLKESFLSGPDAFRSTCDLLLEQDAVAYASIRRTAALRQVAACISKLPAYGGTSHEGRRTNALQAFLAAERKCKRTNKRIAYYAKRPMRLSKHLRLVFRMAQDEILHVLGGPPEFEMFEEAAFGPGLTYGMPAEDRDLFYKINGNQTVTPLAKRLALEVITKLHPRWGGHLAANGFGLDCVPGNRISFVPKSSKTLRTIGIEPSLNVWLQKAVDEFLKRKLKRMNLRLRDQCYSSSLIEEEARSDLAVATIDLKSASDSVARELVRWMLPKEWFELLDILRSPCYTLDKGKTWQTYHKFSSMGNATTFPLESMIFGSIVRACCRVCGVGTSRVRIYGDDVICPPEAALLVIEAFKFAGFEINRDKSFIFGPFRETCGVDLLYGVNVRPVYLRDLPKEPDQVANLFNRLLINEFGFKLPSTLEYLHSLVSRPLYGPAYLGWTSTDRLYDRAWQEWYEGRNTLCDAYFFAPGVVLPSAWSSRYQTTKYQLERWYRPRPFRRGIFGDEARLAAFLYGLEEGLPKQQNRHLKVRKEPFYGLWPDLGWWPDCFGSAVPRDRVSSPEGETP